jgi:hypothetical protein
MRKPMSSQPAGYWEPWQPRLGDRVRVRLSAECRAPWADEGHDPRYDGLSGTVAHFPWSSDWPGHPYTVRFDVTLPTENPYEVLVGGYFAAIELEPLDA